MMSTCKFAKRRGFATSAGPLFEVHMAALLFLRGLNSGMDFQLASNVDGAGAMDDIVFRFRPPTESDIWTLYVQLKHKANRPVQQSLLTSPKGDFSVKKYFDSYREIKQAMLNAEKGTLFDGSINKSLFVIFTNTTASRSLGEGRPKTLCPAEAFLWFSLGKVFSFENDEDVIKSLGECGDEGTTFLGSLKLFCGQPDAVKLEAAIKMELGKVDGKITKGVDVKSLLGCFLKRMKVWWEKSSEVLHKGDDILQSSVLEVISQQTERKLCLDITFVEAALKPLLAAVSGDCKICTVLSSESSCRLSGTKLCQAFGGQALVLECADLLSNKDALLAYWGKGVVKGVIIFTNGWISSHQVEYFDVVKDLLAIPNTPLIVFLAKDESGVVEAIAGEFQGLVENSNDEFIFSQLQDASREKIIGKELSLQGYSTTLRRFLKDTPGSADRVLDACSVVEILECDGSLTLGSAFGEGIGYFVGRSLELANVVKASVFQDGALQETVTIRVMDCDASTSFGPSKQTEESISQQVPNRISEIGLIEKAIHFLSSQLECTHLEKEAVNDVARSLIPEACDSEVAVGPKFQLSSFECNVVALRCAESDPVHALRIRTDKHAIQEACFLFVSDKTNANDLRTLSAAHKSRHLLSLKDDTLRWIQSEGDIELIRPHIDESEECVTKIEINSLEDIEDRLVLVCAEPGMGKSTLTARMAEGKHFCDSFKDHFMFVIVLNDHCQLLAESKNLEPIEGKLEDTLGFLCSAGKIISPLHRSLLQYSLEVSGDVVVLFDGYDEVALKYGEQCCDLISKMIKKTKARKIWVTSRNSFKKQLEMFFSKFALNLSRFDEADQRMFLKMFWETNPKLVLNKEELDQFIDTLLEKTSRAVRDVEKCLMAIPLQTRMLAEVYEDDVTDLEKISNLPDILNLLDLLEKFVAKKFSIYVQEKCQIESSNATYEGIYDMLNSEFFRRHVSAALGLILDNDTIKSLRMESKIRESSEFVEKIKRGKDKTGFIDDVVNGKPRFIHRVFAEYFVAKWFSENFADYPDFIESKMMTDDYTVVRNLFDRLLAKDCKLHTAVVNEDLEEVQTLLEREDIDVNAKDGGGRTALHLAASRGTSEVMEENKKCGEILEVLINKTNNFDQVCDVLRCSPLKYAVLTKSWIAIDKFLLSSKNKEIFVETLKDVTNHDMIDNIFVFDLHHLLGFCIDNGLSVEHCSVGRRRLLLRACEKGSLKTASLLVERNADIKCNRIKVEDNDKKEVEDETPLHVASENEKVKIIELLIDKCSLTFEQEVKKGVLKSLDTSEYINIKNNNNAGDTALHNAARYGHSEVASVLVDKGGDVCSLNNYNVTPLHLAARLNHPITFNVLLTALDKADRAAVLSHCDNDGDSVLSSAAFGGSLEIIKIIMKSSEESVAGTEAPLLAVTERENWEVANSVSAKLKGNMKVTTKVDFLNLRNNDGCTAIHRAASNGHVEVIRCLISHGCDIQIRDDSNSTPLHSAARSKNPIALRVLLDALDEADRAAALILGDKDGDRVLSLAASGGSLECVEILIKASEKFTEVKKSPLLAVADQENQDVSKLVTTKLQGNIEGMTKVDFLNLRNKKGMTAIHHAAWKGHADIIRCLISHGCDKQIRADYSTTPLHVAALYKNPIALACLLEALEEDDRAAALILVDRNGDRVLSFAASGGCVECVEIIIKKSEKFTAVNKSPFLTVADEENQDVSKLVTSKLKGDIEGMTKVKFLNLRNNNGMAAIHHAAWQGNGDVIRFLISQGVDTRIRDGYNSTPLHVAALYKNPIALSVLLEGLDEADRVAVLTLGDQNGDRVLSIAAMGGCLECVEIIIKTSEKCTAVNKSPFFTVSDRENQDNSKPVSTKLNANVEGMTKVDFLNLRNKNGRTAMHIATWKGHADIIRCLISQGGDTRIRDHRNSTPLHLAAELKRPNTVRLLLEILDEADRAAAINQCDKDGNSVLMCGARGGSVESIELLVEAGGNFCQANNALRSSLMLASDRGYQHVVSYLLRAFGDEREGMTKLAFIDMADKDGKTALDFGTAECRDVIADCRASCVQR